MSVRVVEQAVKAVEGGGEVSVRSEADGRVRVTWICGDYRVFDADALREAIANVDRVKGYPDVWLSLTDTTGRAFAVKVSEAGLTADNRAGAHEDNGNVDWTHLKKALKTAAS